MKHSTDLASPHRCHFLVIPKELRIEIYGYLLKPWKLQARSYTEYSTSGLSEREIVKSSFYGKVLEKALNPQLLQVCKTIHSEAQHVLAEPCVLALLPSVHGGPPRHKHERPIDISLFSSARCIRLIELRVTSLPRTAADDFTYSQILAKQFNTNLQVQKLHLTVDDIVTDDPWEGLEATSNATRLHDIRQLLEIWSKLQPLKSFIFSLEIVGVERGLHWQWVLDRKSTEDWQQERGLINDHDGMAGSCRHDVNLADYCADYEEDRLHFILNEVKRAFPMTEKWKSRR